MTHKKKFQIQFVRETGITTLLCTNTGVKLSRRTIEAVDQINNRLFEVVELSAGQSKTFDISHMVGRVVVKVSGVFLMEDFVDPQEELSPFTISQVLIGLDGARTLLITNNGPTLEGEAATIKLERMDGSTILMRFPTLETGKPYLLEMILIRSKKIAIWIGGQLIAYRDIADAEFSLSAWFDKLHRYLISIIRIVKAVKDEQVALQIRVLPSTAAPTHILSFYYGEERIIQENYAAVGRIVTVTMDNILVAAFTVQANTDLIP